MCPGMVDGSALTMSPILQEILPVVVHLRVMSPAVLHTYGAAGWVWVRITEPIINNCVLQDSPIGYLTAK